VVALPGRLFMTKSYHEVRQIGSSGPLFYRIFTFQWMPYRSGTLGRGMEGIGRSSQILNNLAHHTEAENPIPFGMNRPPMAV
jgi:hypothetical protein